MLYESVDALVEPETLRRAIVFWVQKLQISALRDLPAPRLADADARSEAQA